MANVNINSKNLVLEQEGYCKASKISSDVSHFTPPVLPQPFGVL